ncbi:LINE-1 retrotransposable element ORF1 protein [Plecturocebus cupreus]
MRATGFGHPEGQWTLDSPWSLTLLLRLECSDMISVHSSASRVQAILLPQPLKMGFHLVGQAGLELLTSADQPALASQSAGITETGSLYVAQVHLELLGSRDPHTLASQSAGITVVSHCAWPLSVLFKTKFMRIPCVDAGLISPLVQLLNSKDQEVLLQTGRALGNICYDSQDASSSSVMEQDLMENECEESSELGFRRWIIRNFCELKEYVLNQCKETNNFEKRFDEMLTRMDNLEKNINELMELKNIREIREVRTSFNSRIDQVEERILEVEDQLNEMKREDKIREKSIKRNEQNLQEIWDYVKRPNLRLTGIPESDEENESKLENIFQDII